MSPRFRAITFDLDGTLVDSLADIAAALNEVLASLGRPTHPPDAVRTMIGGGVGALLQRGLGDADPILLERGRQRFQEAYQARLVETTRPYPGVLAMLERLAEAGIPLAIATNKPAAFTAVIVERLALRRAGVRGVASADEAPARKPDPAVVELALQRAGVSGLADTLYVGDMPVDRATARAAKIPLAGVAWGFDPEGLRAAAPEFWLDCAEDLERLARRPDLDLF